MASSRAAMSDAVTNILAKIGRPGTFAARLTLPARDLHLDVAGVGRITFPVSTAKAGALCRAARPARHGYKDQTLLNPTVRDTWEISKRKITIDKQRWTPTLTRALATIAGDLGLGADCRLRAELHNLLVYAPGQFFVTHQDSEKADGMVGTLVVTLPSVFDGGAIVVQHHDEKVTFRGSGSELGLIAFYADCHHEVQPVASGHRIVLTYNLLLSKESDAYPPVAPEHLDELEVEVRKLLETPPPLRWAGDRDQPPPDRLVYLLDHEYTQMGLGWTRLKNGDAARAGALREVARRLDCDVALALADVHESWSCADEERDYGYGRRSSRYASRQWFRGDDGDHDDDSDHDDDDGELDDEAGDGGTQTLELLELLDSDVELRHFVDARGRREAVVDSLHDAAICFTKPSVDMRPFKSEHEGYMGNWGNTVDRWYHRAAIVLWPRSRTFAIRAKTSPRWGIDQIAKALARGHVEDARAMAAELAPFWRRTARSAAVATVAARTMRVAASLDAPDLATMLLEPFRVEDLTPRTAASLVGVIDQYGLAWFQKTCGSVVVTKRSVDVWGPRHEREKVWLRSLQAFVRTVRESAHAGKSGSGARGAHRREAKELARWIVAEQWSELAETLRSALAGPPSKVSGELARLDAQVLAVVESALVCEDVALHEEVLRFFMLATYPPLALVQLLKSAQRVHGARALVRLRLASVRDHVESVLAKAIGAPPRASDDWSIAPPSGCSCALCSELGGFLRHRTRTRLEWPLAAAKRAHVHGVLERNELPVTHTTRREGSPYKLVLVKTRALFEREAKMRAALAEAQRWLRGRSPSMRSQTRRREPGLPSASKTTSSRTPRAR
jgi:2OG-Fe(II) oxygenase superfamily